MNNLVDKKFQPTIELYRKLGTKYIRRIGKAEVWDFDVFTKLLPRGGKILDVGCAGGRDVKKFLDCGFQVVGIDLVDIFLKECRKKYPRAKFLKMNAKKLKFPDNSFDAVWVLGVLIHIDKSDIKKTLEEFHRVLKPGGKLMVSVKKGTGLKIKKEKLSENKGRLTVYFLKNEMENYIKKSGFKVIRSKFIPDYLDRGDEETKWMQVWGEKIVR
jgi:ubiquinone/menaquinone biosynthesis C-methylase UbiE